MYQINLGEKILYYPGNEEFTVFDTELQEDVGQAGEFSFSVPASNPLYAELANGAFVTILKNKKEFWRGEIRDISIDFNKTARIYAVEDIAWLADEYLPPAKIINQTKNQRLTAAINTYNSNRPASRQFSVGYVYNGSAACNWKTEYEWSILDSIRKCICGDDQYVRLRRVYESGTLKRYIDIVRLEDYGKTTSQPVEYGYNLLDYVKDSDYGNLTNVLTPYGEELEDQEAYDDYSKRLQGTTISNNASINAYGRHAKAVVFDGVTNVNTLNNLAASYLSRYCQPQLTMEVKAVDLAMIENVEDIAIGDQVRIIAKPFAVDQYLYLTSITRDLQNIDKNELVLSGHVAKRTLTSQIANVSEAVEEIPSEWDLLKTAKKNALAMLLDETQGGYVVYEYDANNQYITAINICNARTIAESTKRWKWGQNGLGYMERPNKNNPWPNEAEVKASITKDGHIVADRIDTGILTAAIIKAGILTDKKGTFSLNMDTGDLIMNRGTFKGSLSAATGTFSGSLSAASGTFSGNLSAAGGTFSGDLSAAGGTFKGTLQAAKGTISDGTGTLSLEGGSLYMRGPNPGVFVNKSSSSDYACWGATNSSARSGSTYYEIPTIKIFQMVQYGINQGWI